MTFFYVLKVNYPREEPCDAKTESGDALFKNQCAIKLSHAMKKSGIDFSGFPRGRKCWVHKKQDHVLAAKELADWLDQGRAPQIGKSIEITGSAWRKKILGKNGIVCFGDYYTGEDGSGGDYIDLWDGSSLTSFGSWLRTRFNIVVPGYRSDFRKSKRIRFFAVP